ncbi:branched-chain-amino-acid aminotransferase-like protein 1 [Acanthaster planci]|uniref:Branched-chain-amino-acid aminotransferase-like protein 1 n=1 Tax=Acanthaster planci TaxID=133434 RepID=A0A8B7ZAQ7_ACAPL|nr:branched-chain-amino-acid aminotransferase-like protein 1 [Acanthaster planci]XP_022101899.1 branched-chain-amino-acid aminotransferase-like protein 1 [Acanthaster planci]XP_022101900.1 branched-chain-amino-acid aminotransferase-like protein 1 [Acanthaster planci]XP_022101901.1 branched-chain-amino-acid aminotransferase-like protein 1 [Acanthaster planci]
MAKLQKASLSDGYQVRLMMWTVPRSLSTVLAKCLTAVDKSKVFFELYVHAHWKDPKKDHDMFDTSEIGKKFAASQKSFTEKTGISAERDDFPSSFLSIKELLEEAHDGKKFILCKDMAHAVTHRLGFLPKDYRHLFLIRHPLKVFPSWKKIFLQSVPDMSPDEFCLEDLPENIFPKGYGYQEISELVDYVKKELDPNAIIIDADDLLQDPKSILSAVFKDIGLPFDEKILHWEAGDAVTHQWTIPQYFLQGNQFGGYYQNALDSTCFLNTRRLPDRSSIPPDLLRLVEVSVPYYEKMYNSRLSAKEESDTKRRSLHS